MGIKISTKKIKRWTISFNFEFCLRRLFTVLYSFFPTKSKFRENLIKTEQLFIKDLKYQFKKILRKNGKYSSGIYGKKGLFLERTKYTYIFDGGSFFKIEKEICYIKKNFISKIFLYLKIFFYFKKFLS